MSLSALLGALGGAAAMTVGLTLAGQLHTLLNVFDPFTLLLLARADPLFTFAQARILRRLAAPPHRDIDTAHQAEAVDAQHRRGG